MADINPLYKRGMVSVGDVVYWTGYGHIKNYCVVLNITKRTSPIRNIWGIWRSNQEEAEKDLNVTSYTHPTGFMEENKVFIVSPKKVTDWQKRLEDVK